MEASSKIHSCAGVNVAGQPFIQTISLIVDYSSHYAEMKAIQDDLGMHRSQVLIIDGRVNLEMYRADVSFTPLNQITERTQKGSPTIRVHDGYRI